MLRVLAAAAILVATTATTAQAKETLTQKTDRYVTTTHHYQRVMGYHLTPTTYSYKRTHSHAYRQWVSNLWKRRLSETARQFRSVPMQSSWLCIHQYEGSWTDAGGPYYGGLQMDLGFQSSYGSYLLSTKGTADHWTPLEQMWVAYNAYRSGRGFNPWPNTARACGLL